MNGHVPWGAHTPNSGNVPSAEILGYVYYHTGNCDAEFAPDINRPPADLTVQDSVGPLALTGELVHNDPI